MALPRPSQPRPIDAHDWFNRARAHAEKARASINKYADSVDGQRELDPVDKANAYAAVSMAESLVAGLALLLEKERYG